MLCFIAHTYGKSSVRMCACVCIYFVYLLRSIFDMLMVLPVLRHWRHHPRDVINFRRLPLLVDTSLPRSISLDRHDDESSKLEPRRWRWKHAQFRSMVYYYFFSGYLIQFSVSIGEKISKISCLSRLRLSRLVFCRFFSSSPFFSCCNLSVIWFMF